MRDRQAEEKRLIVAERKRLREKTEGEEDGWGRDRMH